MKASDSQITVGDRVNFLIALAVPTWLSVQFKSFFTAFPYFQTALWAIVIFYLIGRAVWNLYGRYDIHTGIPPIEGLYTRTKHKVTGVLYLSRNGHEIKGTFDEGSIRHEIDGKFDPNGRKFNVKTQRIDSRQPLGEAFNQAETYWLLDENTICFHSESNALGEPETGILKRKI